MAAKYRVVRTAPTAVDPPCPCSSTEQEVVWEGDDPSQYQGGNGTFDEGCHHPSRTMQVMVEGRWEDHHP